MKIQNNEYQHQRLKEFAINRDQMEYIQNVSLEINIGSEVFPKIDRFKYQVQRST